MYHEIQRLRQVEKFSIQRISDYFSIDFRTAKKFLSMNEEALDEYLEKKGNKSRLLDAYKDFIVNYLKKYQDSPSAVIHDRLKEYYPDFPRVDPKTVYNYVLHLRVSFNLPKVSASQRQYSPVADLPPGEQAQVDFGEKKLRTGTGEWVKVYFFTMLLCHSRQKFMFFKPLALPQKMPSKPTRRPLHFLKVYPVRFFMTRTVFFCSGRMPGIIK